MRTQPKKPTGTIGPLVLGQSGATHKPVAWPGSKELIERHVLRIALDSAKRTATELYDLVQDPIQNEEQHFDFTLQTRAGIQYLDLMEIAPLRKIGGSYASAPGTYVVGEMADVVWEELARKSEGYGTHLRSAVHLLLYPTDWRFRVGPDVTDLLGYWSLSRRHCFRSITYFAPDDEASGEVVRVFPRPRAGFAVFDEAATRGRRVLLADLSSFRTG